VDSKSANTLFSKRQSPLLSTLQAGTLKGFMVMCWYKPDVFDCAQRHAIAVILHNYAAGHLVDLIQGNRDFIRISVVCILHQLEHRKA
jgi:hypothetical protein